MPVSLFRWRPRGGPRLVLIVAALLAVADPASATVRDAAPPAAVAVTPAASPPDPSAVGPGDASAVLYEGVRPDLRDEIVAATAGRLSRYRIDAALETPTDGPGTVRGTLDLRFVNATEAPLPELYLRLYANDPIYAEGGIDVREVAVGGDPVAAELSVGDTVLRVPLPDPLPDGAALDLTLAFDAMVPVAPPDGYGIFGTNPDTATWALAHWYPVLAGYDANGWSIDPVSRNGDPIFSATALYDVRLAAAAELVVVTSGVEVEGREADGIARRRYVTGPVRDFTVVADDDFVARSRRVNGTLVTSYHDPDDAAGGATVLDAGAASLRIYAERFGPYPFREMDLVEVRLRGAGGVEFPQLMYMGESLYSEGNRFRNPRYLEFVTAHEVGHQWWYAVVGNNQHLDAFIDEGLTEYVSSEVYFGDRYGAAAGEFQLELEATVWYLNRLFTEGEEIVDQPTDSFSSGAAYGAMVYGKGAVAFGALRTEIGDEAFFGGLRAYYAAHRFGIATPDDLRGAFEGTAGRDLGDFWTSWFERTDGRQVYTEADFAALLEKLGLR